MRWRSGSAPRSRPSLLTGFALSAATRTAWEDKLRTLGRSLAEGLLAEDEAKIDTEQMIIAAITDIEGPQLAMLEFLVRWEPRRYAGSPPIRGHSIIPEYSTLEFDDSWQVHEREWSHEQIAYARPNLAPITPSLLGTLQRHGLVVQNDNTGDAIERTPRSSRSSSVSSTQQTRDAVFRPSGVPQGGPPRTPGTGAHVVSDRAGRAGVPPLP